MYKSRTGSARSSMNLTLVNPCDLGSGTQAHIIRIEYADHYLFQSKDADVVHAINAFVASLPNISSHNIP